MVKKSGALRMEHLVHSCTLYFAILHCRYSRHTYSLSSSVLVFKTETYSQVTIDSRALAQAMVQIASNFNCLEPLGMSWASGPRVDKKSGKD